MKRTALVQKVIPSLICGPSVPFGDSNLLRETIDYFKEYSTFQLCPIKKYLTDVGSTVVVLQFKQKGNNGIFYQVSMINFGKWTCI